MSKEYVFKVSLLKGFEVLTAVVMKISLLWSQLKIN
jgi:hypothetical protein